MKILFLTLYPDFVPSSRFRIAQYLRPLQEDGFQTEVLPAIPDSVYKKYAGTSNGWHAARYYVSEFFTRIATLLRRSDHDVVVLQKGILSFWLKGMERCLGKFEGRLVFDMDDAVHLRPPAHLPRVLQFLQSDSQTQKLMARARAVITANEELAIVARRLNSCVTVIPTPVDTLHFSAPDRGAESTGPFRLLWMGNRSGNASVNCMAPILAALAGNGIKARLTVLSDSPDFIHVAGFEPGSIAYEKWSLDSERALLASSHAGIMPMDDTAWNRSKSGFKTMLYMACGLPSVSSPVGSITHVVRHGENGFFARSEREWVEALGLLAGDGAMRSRIGQYARKTIEGQYSVAVQYPRFKKVLLENRL